MNIELSDGAMLPCMGAGTWTLKGDVATENVAAALKAGFKLIDTAQMYANEAEVGKGLAVSGVAREDYFLTTKVNTVNMRDGQEKVAESIEGSLEALGCGYLDLLLVHWPVKDCVRDTWQVMEEYVRGGKVRSIGVCNFNPHHLEDLLAYAAIRPVVNQIEVHPLMSQEQNIAFNRSLGIQVQGWGPFGQGDIDIPGIPEIREIALRYGKTPSQIVLRWIVQRGLSTIPRAKPHHFAENLDVFNFSLAPEDMAAISALNRNQRSSPANDPENFPW